MFTDANNDPLTYSLTGLPSGLSFDAGNRTISGTPTQTGSFNLSYAATDGKSAPVSVPILLTVGSPTPGNQSPVAPTVSNLSATVNSAFSQTLPVFTDANNDPLTYSLTGLPSGLSFDAGNRTISGSPTQSGSFNLSYAATDGKSAPVSVPILLTVGTSGGPVVTGDFEGYLTQEANCNTFSGWVYDRNRPNMTFSVEFFEGASIASGTLVGSILAKDYRQHLKDAGKGNGEHWYEFPIPESLKDNQPHTIWARVQGSTYVLIWAPKTIRCAGSGVPPTNQPPVAPTVSALSATVNTAFSQTLPVFNDANNDPLTYSLTGLPSGLSFDAGNRTIAGTPTQTGSFNLSYAATDGKSAPVSVPILLTVGSPTPGNQPPVAPTVSALTATVNSAFSQTLPVFTDANNDPLTYSLTGLPSGLSFDAGNRSISGSPTQSGSFNLSYAATDGKSAPVSTTVLLTVGTSGGTGNPPTGGVTGPGNYEGYLDVVDCNSIQGWIWDQNKPNTVIAVEFLDGSTVIGSTDANLFRPDLQSAGKGNGVHGYAFTVPASLKDGRPHTISGRVPNSSYVLMWSPKTLTCPNGGRQGFESAEASLELTVNPNPSSGPVEISYRIIAGQRADLQIVDMLGRSVWHQSKIGTGQLERETVDLSTLGSNMYLVQLKTQQGMLTKRLLIKP
ncbi:hypothetical protein GCM10027347_34990 [Larkinella harenae]